MSLARLATVVFVIALSTVPTLPMPAASRDCAPCHKAIYDTYEQTPMAQSSGPAGAGLIRETFDHAAFDHAPTGFRYRISQARGDLMLEVAKADGSLRGRKSMPYFVGSGATARSYLLVDDGYLYQSPVAWYAAGKKWGLAPNYETYGYPFLTRPVMPACLSCHASSLTAVPGTQNRYATPPFAEAGISCERCHGAGERHIQKMQSGDVSGDRAIVNPANLPADRRDSVCAQCHLSGEVRVMKPGGDWQSYTPGHRLTDSQTVFVRAGTTPGVRVTSHVEKLALSACKRASGDRLWCGYCHDPHSLPKPADRAAFFRGKCQSCHESKPCTATHAARAARQDDCAACHMPKSTAADAQHVVYTDHSIPRRPRKETVVAASADLVPFAQAAADPRDLALAYAIVASRTSKPADQNRAIALLEPVERHSPEDVEVLLYLAELYRNTSRPDAAIPLYRRAMQLDKTQVTASVGLGGILMERGDFAGAISLWQDALARNGGLPFVRVNLAMAQWRSGDPEGAESTLRKAIELSPAFPPALELMEQLHRR